MSNIKHGRETLKRLYDAEVEKVLENLSENESDLGSDFDSSGAFDELSTSAERLRTLSLLTSLLPADPSTQQQGGNGSVVVVAQRGPSMYDFFDAVADGNRTLAAAILQQILKLTEQRAIDCTDHFMQHAKSVGLQTAATQYAGLGKQLTSAATFKATLKTMFGVTLVEAAQLYERYATE